jgi:4a-hydroxytetrahydrobiopterin dehydratase
MTQTLFDPHAVQEGLTRLTGWTLNGNQIEKTVERPDFVQAMGFVTSVALLAQAQDHHPDIDIRWNTVKLVLSTHSAGGLTAKDFSLAQDIDAL